MYLPVHLSTDPYKCLYLSSYSSHRKVARPKLYPETPFRSGVPLADVAEDPGRMAGASELWDPAVLEHR